MNKCAVKSEFINSIVILSSLFLFFVPVFSQGTAVPFLIESPSPAISGMGGAGVAIPNSDAFNFFYNPAQLGLIKEKSSFVFGFSSFQLEPSYNDNYLKSIALQGVYDCSKYLNGLPLTIGAGFIHQNSYLGELVLGHFYGEQSFWNSTESNNSITLSAGLNYFVCFGFGISFKYLSSELTSLVNRNYSLNGTAGAVDIGLLAEIPIIKSLELSNDFNFNFNASLGSTLANLGSKLTYRNKSDPLPRIYKIGYGLYAGIELKTENIKIQAIRIDWTAEANDILVTRDSLGYQYKPIFGDINIWDNVIRMKKMPSTASVRYGIRTSLFEILDLSFGYYDDSRYNFSISTEKTFGVSFGLKGIFKLYYPFVDNSIAKFIYNHVNIQFSYVNIRVLNEFVKTQQGRNRIDWLQKYWSLSLTLDGL